MNQEDMLKLLRRENGSLATAYENAIGWLAISTILNVTMLVTLWLK